VGGSTKRTWGHILDMVETINDSEGRCIAFLEWSMVNAQGILDDKGEYVFVRELWIWKGMKHGLYLIKSFIKKICEEFPQAKYGYWKRKKYGDRVKVFGRDTIYGS
jgi:hypothetical protein